MTKGDWVRWSSQTHGRWRTKRGRIIAVLPARKSPFLYIPPGYHFDNDSPARAHKSYLIEIPGDSRIYWPRVSKLRLLRWRSLISRYLLSGLGIMVMLIVLGLAGESDRQAWQAAEQAWTYRPGGYLYYQTYKSPNVWVRIEDGQVYNLRGLRIGEVRDGEVWIKGKRRGTL